MKDLLLGQEPAFPTVIEDGEIATESGFMIPNIKELSGMSKRFYAACTAMQGLLPIIKEKGRFVIDGKPLTPQNIAVAAYIYADELLKLEQKQNETNS